METKRATNVSRERQTTEVTQLTVFFIPSNSNNKDDRKQSFLENYIFNKDYWKGNGYDDDDDGDIYVYQGRTVHINDKEKMRHVQIHSSVVCDLSIIMSLMVASST